MLKDVGITGNEINEMPKVTMMIKMRDNP